ncbi:MAG: DUF302 domain-containing protein [Actinomycetia bacterium]|nr:DUF302 domain-containing protein [Actinomycetes bacterium]
MSYTFETTVPGTMDSVRAKVEAALAVEGFGILTEIDVAATFKAKLDVDRDPYVILGACNPSYAHDAIGADANMGALLPCNVVLRQGAGDDNVEVVFMDPAAVLGLVDVPGVDTIAQEVKAKLESVASSLTG